MNKARRTHRDATVIDFDALKLPIRIRNLIVGISDARETSPGEIVKEMALACAKEILNQKTL